MQQPNKKLWESKEKPKTYQILLRQDISFGSTVINIYVSNPNLQERWNRILFRPCPNTGSQWIIKVHRVPFVKMDRLFTTPQDLVFIKPQHGGTWNKQGHWQRPNKKLQKIPSLKLTYTPSSFWKWMVGRRSFPFWEFAYFQGLLLFSVRECSPSPFWAAAPINGLEGDLSRFGGTQRRTPWGQVFTYRYTPEN